MGVSTNKLKELSAHDFELITRLSERIHYTNPNEPFLNHAYVVLNEALPSNYLSVESYSVHPLAFEQAVGGITSEMDAICRKYLHQHPVLRHYVTHGGKPSVNTILSLTSSAKFHKTDLYQKFYKVLGIEDQLVLILLHPTGGYVVAYSRETTFTEKEKTIMELLKPQLYIAIRNWQRNQKLEKLQKLLGDKSVVRGADYEAKRLIDCLTPKQRAVAELVALGLQNNQIAERLHISPKTVGKHLENIFETLDIHHRAALATLWQKARPAE